MNRQAHRLGKRSTFITNNVACKLKLGDLKGACWTQDFAMREGENNVKALFRQEHAHMLLNYDMLCYILH